MKHPGVYGDLPLEINGLVEAPAPKAKAKAWNLELGFRRIAALGCAPGPSGSSQGGGALAGSWAPQV